MYQYKFVKATLGGFFEEENHRDIINQHAQDGWRLVQVLPSGYKGHGKPINFEIIFEKKVDA